MTERGGEQSRSSSSPLASVFNISLLLLAIAVTGCGDGMQRGKFSSVRSETTPVAPEPGYASIYSGYALSPDGQATGDLQNLLFIVLVCPGAKGGANSGVEEQSDTFTSTYTYRIDNVATVVRWDRQADSIEFEGKFFDREKGNVFVVRRQQNRKLAVQQLSSLNPKRYVGFKELFNHVKTLLPDDGLLGSLHPLN
jgi:hypothetical protein